MSTKTTIKRVALVAAVALTLGGFSAVSASAANTALFVYTADGAIQDTTGLATGAGVAGPSNSVIVRVKHNASLRTSVVVTGGTIASVADSGTATVLNATSGATGAIVASAGANDYANLTIPTPAVGTITINSYLETAANSNQYSTTANETVVITVNATASSGVLSVAKSTSVISATSNGAFTSDDTVVKSSTVTIGTASSWIKVSTNDALGTALNDTLTATIAGPGLIKAAADTSTLTSGVNARVSSFKSAAGVQYIGVAPDGTAGTATISIYDGTTLISTETVVFYGLVASLSATQNLKIASTAGAALGGTTSTTAAVTVLAKDSAGNAVGGLTLTATPADTAIIASGTCAEDSTTKGTYYCSVTSAAAASGKSSTVVFSATGATTIKSDAVTFTLGGAIKTVTAAFDAASYEPGTALALVYTAKDSSGNAAFDGARAAFTNGGVKFNYGTGISTAADTATFVGGVATLKTYAPLASGNVIATATYGADAGADLAATSFTVTAVVSGGTDSSLAVDAANAATDAANAAAEEASNATEAASEALAAVNSLATTVASLIAGIKKQLVALTALVKKLQK